MEDPQREHLIRQRDIGGKRKEAARPWGEEEESEDQ